jgi:hypothetical protein
MFSILFSYKATFSTLTIYFFNMHILYCFDVVVAYAYDGRHKEPHTHGDTCIEHTR